MHLSCVSPSRNVLLSWRTSAHCRRCVLPLVRRTQAAPAPNRNAHHIHHHRRSRLPSHPQALRRLSPHPNIVKLHEVLYDQPTGRLALVFELMDCNIYELIKGRTHYLPEETVKIYMYQLMKAVDHMHRHGIFHRDIKPENLLIVDNVLKLADFGSCRGIYSKQPYTEYISTRWCVVGKPAACTCCWACTAADCLHDGVPTLLVLLPCHSLLAGIVRLNAS